MKLYDIGREEKIYSGEVEGKGGAKTRKYYPSITVEAEDLPGLGDKKVGSTFQGTCEMMLQSESVNIKNGKVEKRYELEVRKVGFGGEE